MKKLLGLVTVLILLGATSCASAESVSYQHLTMNGAPTDVVKADLKDPHVYITPVVAQNFPYAPEYFEDIVARAKPVAAINGNFFCKRTYKPIGDLVVDGKLVYFGGMGTAMAITHNNKVKFIQVDKYHHMNWDNYKAVISCGPLLLSNGKIVVDARSEGFSDPNIFGPRNRSAVGITWDDNLLFVTVNRGVYFEELAQIMKDLGCRDAMNLDGGGSSGLYYKGEMILTPRSPMPDILVVQEREFAPNFLVNVSENLVKNQKRIDILSSVTFIVDKNQFLVKDFKDDKVLMIMRFDNPQMLEMPQIDAKVSTVENRLTITIPIERLKDLIRGD